MPYLQALKAFREVCPAELIEYDLGDNLGRRELVIKALESDEPDLIFTLGARAAYAVSSGIRDIPIIFSLVSTPEAYGIAGRNVTGVKSTIPIETQIEIFQETIPRLKRIGLVYSDPGLEEWISRAEVLSRNRGLELMALRISSANEIPDALDKIFADSGLLWLIYDPMVTSSRKIIKEWIMLPALRKKIPVAGFNKWSVAVGALLTVYGDYEDMGEQAGEMANRILEGVPPRSIPVESPEDARVLINPRVAERLKIDIPSDAYIYSGEDHEEF